MNEKKRNFALLTSLIISIFVVIACTPESPTPDANSPASDVVADATRFENPTVRIAIEGLRNPLGLASLSDGTIIIAEEGTGERDLSAGVSIRTPDGRVGRLVSGLPSGRDSGDLSGVAMVGVAPDERLLYIGNFNQGHLWTLPIPEEGLSLPDFAHTPDDLGVAMEALNRVALMNPFGITFSVDGVPIVSDASEDGVARELPDGRTQFIHRFTEIPDPNNERLMISPVPTGIERIGDEYYVTLTGGCPYPPQSGLLVAIDENRNQRTVADGLNMPIDVALGDDGTIWVLEFARFASDGSCFSGMGYLPRTGRLSILNADGTLQTILENLNFPGAVLPMPDGSLYISQIFNGEILHVTFHEEADASADEAFTLPNITPRTPEYNVIDDMDEALRQVIARQGLTAYPGHAIREGNTPLAQLGRDLFFDPILSGDRNISCATCHHPALAMADGRVLPIGTGGVGLGTERDYLSHIILSDEYYNRNLRGAEVPNPANGMFVPRNSPTIINSALLDAQFWDGRIENYAFGIASIEPNVAALELTDALVAQALFPITSRVEMGGATFGEAQPMSIRMLLVERLMSVPEYQRRFQQIFGTETITPVQIATAIAAFERQLVFTDSAWDDYIDGDDDALTEQQKRGALLFYGALNDAVNCAICHTGDSFTDLQYHNLLVPQIGPGKGNGVSRREDWGRANVTFDWRDRYQFRTAPLRNVALTAPYFHTGAYQTLEDVIWHHADVWTWAQDYDPSTHLPQSFYSMYRASDLEAQSRFVSPILADGLPLSERDVADLVAFLHSLTDAEALDLAHLVPDSVPSGLSLDPIPDELSFVQVNAPGTSPQSAVQVIATPAPDEPTSDEGWHFVDVAQDVGLDFVHGAFQFGIYEDPAAMMGAGLCWIDYDNDGWLDLYVVNSHAEDEARRLADNMPQNRLYRNVEGVFVDVSQETGTDLIMRGNGCVAADFNMNGWMDLYISADDEDVLLINQGDGTFVDKTAEAGLGAPEWTSAIAVADLNGNGYPDLFVGAFIDLNHKIPNPMGAFPQDYFGLPDRLYINNGINEHGDVTFTEVTLEVGLLREERALGAIFTDVDRDGRLDLYIANDGQPNRLYRNVAMPDDPLGIGFRFEDLVNTANVGDAGSGMGVASGDFDGDGYFDLVVTNWDTELNALYRNETHEQGFINFRYSTFRMGMRGFGNNQTGWGITFADFDHDTDLDMLVVNGRVPISNFNTDAELVQLYRNYLVERGQPHFMPWTNQVGLHEVGRLMARGSAVADYNNNGRLDVAINSIGGEVVLLENRGVQGNWLMLAFERFAPGTIAIVTLPDGRELIRERHTGSSYLASEDPRLHFGLGDVDVIPSIQIIYPFGDTITLTNVEANQVLQLD